MTIYRQAAPVAATNRLALFTLGLFGLFPASLTMAVLRFTLALPFLKAGMTDWDGWFTLSFGVKARFGDLMLHIFGAEYPLPMADRMALFASVAEVALPILLIVGLATRYAAVGLLVMTAVIQLSVPDGWQNFHLPWAAMELAILTFGPGLLSLDYALGLDRVSRRSAQ
jgi:putative oxidoreductase